MKTVFGLILSTLLISQIHAGELSELVGRYPVLFMDGKHVATGFLTIRSDDETVGYTIDPVPMASSPARESVKLSDASNTTITKVGHIIEQRWQKGDEALKVDYQVMDGFMRIRSQDCDASMCSGETVYIGVGKSYGGEVDAVEFFGNIKGDYRIQLAGGADPKEMDDASVSLDDARQRAVIQAPYCWPGGTVCDQGFIRFPYGQTRVFERRLDTDHVIYDVFLNKSDSSSYFSWEARNGQIILRNVQYNLGGKSVCLEHVMVPVN